MKWVRERDALIAQTMAFVQSVTGRKEELLPAGARPVLPPAPIEIARIAAEPTAEFVPHPQTAETSQPYQVSPPRTSGDFRTEVLDRVATFRKHQERFEREREEYCAETLAKLRASIGDPGVRDTGPRIRDTGPRLPSGK